MSLIYSFPMKLSPDNQGTSKPPQGRGRGIDRQTGGGGGNLPLLTIWKSEKNVYVHHSSIWRALVGPRGTHYQFSIYRAYLQRTCWARPSVFSERHMRWLLIHGVESSQRIMLSRQTPSSFHRQGMPHFFPSTHKYSQDGNGVSTALLS